MRLFIAIHFDDSVLDALASFQQGLRKIGMIGNYTSEENLHLTLAFIGEYGNPDEVLQAITCGEPWKIRQRPRVNRSGMTRQRI